MGIGEALEGIVCDDPINAACNSFTIFLLKQAGFASITN
jgi:hypothetical protein